MILVFGKTGQVATELARQAGARVLCLARDKADLSDPSACAAAISAHAPKAVINAAAWTAVDKAEDHEAEAHVINAQAPAAMAQACADRDIPFIHISTDYVFKGIGTAPWSPTDPVVPQNAYGRTKLAGENAVRGAGGAFVILRTSWVVSAHGANFVKTMLQLGAERDRLAIVADQIGGPTPAAAIASACLEIAFQLQRDSDKSGTYHFSGAPDVSWADFAREIFVQANITCTTEDISTSAFPAIVTRPANSRLDCNTLETMFGLPRPDWRVGLNDILVNLGAYKS